MEPSSFDSRHRVSVDELSVTERIFAKRAFNLEPEFAIERDRRLVVCENGELDPRQIQPCSARITRVPIYFARHVHDDCQHDEECDRAHEERVILLPQSDIEKCVNTSETCANH